MLAVMYALVSVTTVAFIKIILKLSVNSGAKPIATLILYNLGAFLCLVPFFGIPSISGLNALLIGLLLLNGLLWVGACFCEIKSYEVLDASVGELFGTATFILTTLAGVFLFDENISWLAAIGIAMIVGAAVCGSHASFTGNVRGYLLRVIGSVLFASGMVLNKMLIPYVSLDTIILSGFLVPGIFYLLVGYKSLPQIATGVRNSRGWLLLVPPLEAIAYTFSIKAFASGYVTVTSTIFQLCVAVIFILEVLLLGKRENFHKRAATCALCVLGAVTVCWA